MELVPEGTSTGVVGNRTNSLSLFKKFLNLKSGSWTWPDCVKDITVSLLQEFALFITTATYGANSHFYSHQVGEVYWNSLVGQVESSTNQKFDADWKSRMVVKIKRTIITRQITEGEDVAVKISVGRITMMKLMFALFKSFGLCLASVDNRVSSSIEYKMAGR